MKTMSRSFLLLSLLLVGCSLSKPIQPTSSVTPPNPRVEMLTATPSPIATSLTAFPTATVQLTPTMPAYFKPNPALMPLGEWRKTHETGILTPTVEPTPVLPASIESRPEFSDGIIRYQWSPDKRKLLVVTNSRIPLSSLVLGEKGAAPTDYPYPHEQTWILDLESRLVKPVYFTNVYIDTQWAGSDTILVYSSCYGGLGISGVHAIDVETGTLHTVYEDYYGNCEGGVPLSISPDGAYIAYGNGLQKVLSNEIIQVCPLQEYARSYQWSADSLSSYFSCGSEELSDELYQFNVVDGSVTRLTSRDVLTFKALNLWVVDNAQYIIFEWGTNKYANFEKYGLWVIDLT